MDDVVVLSDSSDNISFDIADLLANDTDPDGSTLSVTSFDTSATEGTLVNNGDGTVTYTKSSTFDGFDRFFYTLSDGMGGTSGAEVVIAASEVPELVDGGSVSAGVQGFEAAIKVLLLFRARQDGALSLEDAISDETFEALHDNPLFVPGYVEANDDGPLVVDKNTSLEIVVHNVLLINDGTSDGFSTVEFEVSQPQHGSLSDNGLPLCDPPVCEPEIDPIRILTYTPNPEFVGTDTFTYLLVSSTGTVDVATVTIEVQ